MASLGSAGLLSSIHDSRSLVCSSSRALGSSSASWRSSPGNRKGRKSNNQLQVVAMAPEEEKLTRRNPLDFPIVSSHQLEFGSFPQFHISVRPNIR